MAVPTSPTWQEVLQRIIGTPSERRRLATAQKYVTGFGIATECGFGRRPQATIPELLRLHREVAAAL